jgi:peptide/nickel transport system permease protein
MAHYIIRRFMAMFVSIILMSVVAFVLISLPPGSYLELYIMRLEASGQEVDQSMIENLTIRYGYNQPFVVQYYKWVSGFWRGDLGRSFQWGKPVLDLIQERLPFTLILAFGTIFFTFAVSIPIGIYSATKQYSPGDYVATIFGFLGLATPNFLLALILMYFLFKFFGIPPGGLFSREFIDAAWSFGKFVDLLKHLIVPIIVVGTAGTAGLIRTMRGMLLDELSKDYVDTARMKGVSERKALYKYPVRVAINPLISTIGWLLPSVISGATITSIVLNLPTLGPLLLNALMSQDMYLAGSIVLILTMLTLVGTFVSDILLAWSDPRIRYN